MIVADLTIWSAALRGCDRAFESLFTALMQRCELTSPGVVFAQLLAEHEEPNDAARLRTWAMGAPPVDEPRATFMAIGDLAAHLAGLGVHLNLTDTATLVLCLREDWPLWSYNPLFDAVAQRIPQLRRYQPTGL